MSPEEYAALLASGKVSLRRDADGNIIYDAARTSTGVLPRDILEQLERARAAEVTAHEARLKSFDHFLYDLKTIK